MDNVTRMRLRAINQPRVNNVEELALANTLSGYVRRLDFVGFSDFRHEFRVERIAAGLAKDAGRDSASQNDRAHAQTILETPEIEQSKDEKNQAVRARVAFSRFCSRHDTGSLENRGGANPHHHPVRFRSLHKKAQEVVDCSNSTRRMRLSRDYVEEAIGRALALIDALERVPRRSVAAPLLETKKALESALQILFGPSEN